MTTMMHIIKRSWLFLLTALVLGVGQFLIFQGQLIFGLLSSICGVMLLYWLLAQPKEPTNWMKVISITLLMIIYISGAYLSSASARINNLMTIGFFLVGLLLVFSFFPPFKKPDSLTKCSDDDAGTTLSSRNLLINVSWVAVVMVAIIYLSKKYLVQYDAMTINHFFFPLREVGTLNNYITSLPFKEWSRLWLPAVYLVGLFWWHRRVTVHGERMKDWQIIGGVFLAANIGSLILASLSSDGLYVLPQQVKSLFFHYYTVAREYATFTDVWNVMSTYATKEMNQWVSFPSTHPPLGVVITWLLIKITGDSPTLIALIMGMAAWSAVIPMYFIGRELYHRQMGYTMAALYAVLPNILLFSYTSFDAVYAACMAWIIALMIIGTRRKEYYWMVIAGLAVFLAVSLCYVVPLYVPAMFMFAIMGLRKKRDWKSWTKEAVIKGFLFILAIAVPFWLFSVLTHHGYDYLEMFNHTMHYAHVKGTELRPWFIWSWLAPSAYFIHAGVIVTTLFILRFTKLLRGQHPHDYFPWIALVTIVVPFLTATSRGETDRQFMVLNPLVVGTAAMIFWKCQHAIYEHRGPKPWGVVNSWALILAMALSYINAVVIQIITIDHW